MRKPRQDGIGFVSYLFLLTAIVIVGALLARLQDEITRDHTSRRPGPEQIEAVTGFLNSAARPAGPFAVIGQVYESLRALSGEPAD